MLSHAVSRKETDFYYVYTEVFILLFYFVWLYLQEKIICWYLRTGDVGAIIERRHILLHSINADRSHTIVGRFSQNCEKRLLASFCPSVPSVRIRKLDFHRTHFLKIWHLRVFRKHVENIQVSLKPDKNNRYFSWRLLTFITTSR
jgi:hypothetical protein